MSYSGFFRSRNISIGVNARAIIVLPPFADPVNQERLLSSEFKQRPAFRTTDSFEEVSPLFNRDARITNGTRRYRHPYLLNN